jgi:hypothetical protein
MFEGLWQVNVKNPFDAVTGYNVLLAPSTNTIAGNDIIKQLIPTSTSRGAPAYQLVNQPLGPNEHGITFRFLPQEQMTSGFAGQTRTYGPTDILTCDVIARANVNIVNTPYNTSTLRTLWWHEAEGRAVGYGASGGSSPFEGDTMYIGGSLAASVRDLDGRKLVNFFGPGIDLAKYAK